MREAFLEVWKNPYVRVVAYLGLFYLVYLFLVRAAEVVGIFVAAYILAYLANPVLTWLEHRRVPRWAGVLLVYLFGFLFLALASVLVYQVVAELSVFVADLPSLVEGLLAWLRRVAGVLDRSLGLGEELEAFLRQASGDLGALLGQFTQTFLSWLEALLAGGKGLVAGVAQVVGGLFQLVLVLLVAAYLMLDFPRVGETFRALVPRPYRGFAEELAVKLDRAVGGYIRGQLVVAALAGLTLGVGYALLGIPMAASLGFIGAVFNLIPYLGGLVSLLLAVLLAATKGWIFVLGAVFVFVIENQLEANLYSPWVLSKTTELHPVSVILAILTGAALFGLWGALLAVPAAAFLKLLFTDYYPKSRFYREG